MAVEQTLQPIVALRDIGVELVAVERAGVTPLHAYSRSLDALELLRRVFDIVAPIV